MTMNCKDSFWEMVFLDKKSDKLTIDIKLILLTFLDKLKALDYTDKIIFYDKIPNCTSLISIIEEKNKRVSKILKLFIIFFYSLKKKPKEGR